jgi:YHS domain-containing protein
MMWTIWILAAVGALSGTLAASPGVAEGPPAAARLAAEAKPARIGDEVTCTIDGMKMRLAADTPSAEYRGKTHYFCSEDEKRAFLQDPEHNIKH